MPTVIQQNDTDCSLIYIVLGYSTTIPSEDCPYCRFFSLLCSSAFFRLKNYSLSTCDVTRQGKLISVK